MGKESVAFSLSGFRTPLSTWSLWCKKSVFNQETQTESVTLYMLNRFKCSVATTCLPLNAESETNCTCTVTSKNFTLEYKLSSWSGAAWALFTFHKCSGCIVFDSPSGCKDHYTYIHFIVCCLLLLRENLSLNVSWITSWFIVCLTVAALIQCGLWQNYLVL